MKAQEIIKVAKCANCGNPFGKTGAPFFYRVSIETFGVDFAAMRRYDGLAMMMGSTALANAMGPDEDIALPVGEPVKVTLCSDCVLRELNLLLLIEKATEDK